MIKLIFPGKCISKDNEKIFNKRGQPFLSAKYKAFANHIQWEAKSQYKKQPLEGPLYVDMTFWMPNRTHCDLLNLPKGIIDALQGIAFINDKQIMMCTLKLRYDKLNPRTEIGFLMIQEKEYGT